MQGTSTTNQRQRGSLKRLTVFFFDVPVSCDNGVLCLGGVSAGRRGAEGAPGIGRLLARSSPQPRHLLPTVIVVGVVGVDVFIRETIDTDCLSYRFNFVSFFESLFFFAAEVMILL